MDYSFFFLLFFWKYTQLGDGGSVLLGSCMDDLLKSSESRSKTSNELKMMMEMRGQLCVPNIIFCFDYHEFMYI